MTRSNSAAAILQGEAQVLEVIDKHTQVSSDQLSFGVQLSHRLVCSCMGRHIWISRAALDRRRFNSLVYSI